VVSGVESSGLGVGLPSFCSLSAVGSLATSCSCCGSSTGLLVCVACLIFGLAVGSWLCGYDSGVTLGSALLAALAVALLTSGSGGSMVVFDVHVLLSLLLILL